MLAGIVFWVLAVVAVAAGVAVFRVDSMARATYALAASFVAVGLALLLLDLQFLGVITVLMMVMEMAVMAVYMMFMGMNPALMPMSMVHGKRSALAVSLGTFGVLAAGILGIDWPTHRRAPAADLVRSLGEALMGSKMLVMMTVSPVLFATIVAALVLALPRSRYDRLGDDLQGEDVHGGGRR
jgi:NADH:ubiquinone oxidoreductase subunit 6 (subunit J)